MYLLISIRGVKGDSSLCASESGVVLNDSSSLIIAKGDRGLVMGIAPNIPRPQNVYTGTPFKSQLGLSPSSCVSRAGVGLPSYRSRFS